MSILSRQSRGQEVQNKLKSQLNVNNIFAYYDDNTQRASGQLESDNLPYVEIGNIQITPQQVVFTNPFEGKVFKEIVSIRNSGKRPLLIRLLTPSSSGIRVKTIKNGIFLCSGMSIKRTITYRVQMMTLIQSCYIPIYIGDDHIIDYPIRIVTTPINLQILPDTFLNFEQVDVSCTPSKRTLTIVNSDVKPVRFSVDYRSNEVELSIEPLRGIIMGESKLELVVTATFTEEGEFSTEFWIITDTPICIHIRAVVGIPNIVPQFVPRTASFTFIEFPVTYYGATAVRNIVVHNTGMVQSFFCILGEIEMETFTLKELRKDANDYKFFKISPEEGRLLPKDIRVFQLTYSPYLRKNIPKRDYHLVMIRIKRLQLKDLNPNDYSDDVFDEPLLHTSIVGSLNDKISNTSIISEECLASCELEMKESQISLSDTITTTDVRFMLYGQVEEVAVSIIPDELILHDVEVNQTVTRVFKIQNNCPTLPIIFRYQKIAFVEIEPKLDLLKPLESVEVQVFITPKSFDRVRTNIVFELLYYHEPRRKSNLVVVGNCKIPFVMNEVITAKKKPSDSRLALNFEFKKPNQRPNCAIMNILMNSDIYIGLPDDRPHHNLPDPFRKTFKTIYAAIPRYQPNFNEYALTPRDKKLLKAKNYYNIYINMAAKKKQPITTSSVCTAVKCSRHSERVLSNKSSDTMATIEFIPLTPIQLVSIDLEPRSLLVENVAFNSTYTHTLKVTNRTNSFLKIFLKSRKQEYVFFNGQRFTISPNTQKDLTFLININASPIYNYELDVIINNCFVLATTVLVKARPKHLSLNMEMMTFHENEPPSKFIELYNELNVDIPFLWRIPNIFQVDPIEGLVVSGRFVACMITFEIGLAENMVYDLGLHTDNKFYNLKVLIEGTNYKIKMPKVLAFEELSLNVPCYKTIPMSNCSQERLFYEVGDKNLPEGFKVRPKTGFLSPWSTINLTVCVNRNQTGDFKVPIEITVVYQKKIIFEATGKVIIPELHFKPEILRFRKMAASSFDIACVTVVNTSNVMAVLQFDTDRFPEFNYSEFTNSPFMTSRDALYIKPKEEKDISIHFYPFNPLVTSFPLPLVINKIGLANKSKTMLLSTKPSVKVHAQVLSYKLDVKSWKYNFIYFPHFDHKNVTSQYIKIGNPCKNLITFCIRLDDLAEPFGFRYFEGAKTIDYQCSIVVDLQPDEFVIFEATFFPREPGQHSMRLPVYIRDDFTQDMHNYFYFVGSYPEATFKFSEGSIHLGFIPLSFTISRNVIIDMSYHHPNCNCTVVLNDLHCYVEIDTNLPKSISFYKVVSIIFNSSRTHFIHNTLELACNCPGPNLEIEVFGGCENDYFTIHACIQYFKITSTTSLSAIFDTGEEVYNMSTITIQDTDKEEAFKHSYKTDLPYFQSGNEPFDVYMQQVVAIFEKWLTEQVFFGVKAYTIPDTICIPEVKEFEKQGKRDAVIKVPLQHIMNYLLGFTSMAPYEIKYSDKKPIWMFIRKFYRNFLNHLLSIGCFVNMIKPEILLPYDMYQEYMTYVENADRMLTAKLFYLLAKQSWLDLLMQSYKQLIPRRILQYLTMSSSSLKSLKCVKSSHSTELLVSHHGGISISSVNIFSDESVMLLVWVNKHFQSHKEKFASAYYGNEMDDIFRNKNIENFDNDLSDSLGIISCLLAHCSFLEEHIMGIYAPAKNRMENFNNACILIKILSLLNVSFKLEPINIVEPITIHMIMFLTYLYSFLLPLKSKDNILFSAVLSQTQVEVISILNESKHKMYYKVIFFDNTDDLFSVKESQIIIEPDRVFKLEIQYYARFLRIQKTVLLLSGESPGYQYTNSKLFFLEGLPDMAEAGMPPIVIKSMVYRITNVRIEIQSPYHEQCTYEIFLAKEDTSDVSDLLANLIPYSKVQETRSTMRLKLDSAIAESDEAGKITKTADICNTVNTSRIFWIVFREATIGDFIAKIEIVTKPMKKFNVVQLKLQKVLSKFPCTCPKKRPDVTNRNCPRNAMVLIPCRNEYLWNSVMQSFLAGRDPEEAEFWDIYGNTLVGSHIVERILFDHKRFLSNDMAYFMNKTFKYNVKTKSPDSITTQKTKIIKEATVADATTEILVHLNETVKYFYLVLDSIDEKENRTYKVKVTYV